MLRLSGKPQKLAKIHLLTSFGGDRLKEDLRGGPGVELAEEPVDTGLSEPSEELTEGDEFFDGRKRIRI